MPPPPDSFLADGSGRTLIGGVAVAGTEADPEEAEDGLADALAEVLADALVIAVADDDAACTVWDTYSSLLLRSALVLSSVPVTIVGDSAGFSGWFSLFGSSVLRSSSSTLRTRVIPVGAWEIVGTCTTETDGRTSPLMLDAR
jgi:hypothetical protein